MCVCVCVCVCLVLGKKKLLIFQRIFKKEFVAFEAEQVIILKF